MDTLDLVHTDLCGPVQTPAPGGKRYVLTFLDDWSKMVKVYFLATKDQVYEHFKVYKAATEKATGKKIKALRSDGGGEYVGQKLQDFLKQHGIEHQKTAPYSPQQNGAAERLNRTLIEMARTMLCHAQHSKGMWAEAVSYSAYLLNRLPTSSTGISPYKKWYGHDPDLTNVKVWGCLGYAHVAPHFRGKLDAKTEPVRFLGFDIGTKAYRVLLLNTNNVVLRRDVVFIEDRFHPPRERRASSSGTSSGASTIEVELSNV
ncbi:MAG: transposase family protein, partial [Gammaproteobacteria bacterium]|nr:transposase family protein [Gammaproteobacteria bacterium]